MLPTLPTLTRYVLFQIPGWIIAAIGLTALWYWEILRHWTAVICFSGWVLKDFVLYPLVRTGYETKDKTGSQALVGARGMAEHDLAPEGYVRVRGELWHAVADPPERRIPCGSNVEIVGAEGMKVFVRTVKAEQIQ